MDNNINIPIYGGEENIFNLFSKILKDNNLIICRQTEINLFKEENKFDMPKFKDLILEYWKYSNAKLEYKEMDRTMVEFHVNHFRKLIIECYVEDIIPTYDKKKGIELQFIINLSDLHYDLLIRFIPKFKLWNKFEEEHYYIEEGDRDYYEYLQSVEHYLDQISKWSFETCEITKL